MRRQTAEPNISSLLQGEIDAGAIFRPFRRALTVINRGADLAPVAPVGVHRPNMRVFHRRLRRSQPSLRSQIYNHFSVRRPARDVFDVFSPSQLSNLSVAYFDREHVVVEKTVGIRL